MFKLSRLKFLVTVLVLFTAYATIVSAYPGGVSGYTPKSGIGCTCHSSSPNAAVTSALTGPDTVVVGQTYTYTITISRTATFNGCGLDIAVQRGVLGVGASGSSIKVLNAELTHTHNLGVGTTSVAVTFSYTAPSTAGTDIIYATGAAGSNPPPWNFAPNKNLVVKTVTGITRNSEVALKYSLSQNYPNPFNPVTKFNFSIPKSGNVKITVYDMSGKTIDVLANQEMEAGNYSMNWNAAKYGSGVYFYSIKANDFNESKRMTMIK